MTKCPFIEALLRYRQFSPGTVRPSPFRVVRYPTRTGFYAVCARISDGVVPTKGRESDEETTMRSQNPTGNAVSGIGDLECEEQAIYPLPEPRRHVHRLALLTASRLPGSGRNRPLQHPLRPVGVSMRLPSFELVRTSCPRGWCQQFQPLARP